MSGGASSPGGTGRAAVLAAAAGLRLSGPERRLLRAVSEHGPVGRRDGRFFSATGDDWPAATVERLAEAGILAIVEVGGADLAILAGDPPPYELPPSRMGRGGHEEEIDGIEEIRRAIEGAPVVAEAIAAATAADGFGGGPPPPAGPDGEGGDGGDPVDWDLLRRCAAEPETDIGNARRFLARFGDRVIAVHRIGFHVYDGRRWAEDVEDGHVRPLAHETAEKIALEARVIGAASEEERAAMAAGDPAVVRLVRDRRARRQRWARTSGNKSKIDGMLNEARPYRSVDIGDLDRDPLAVNTASGTLRFVREPDPECPDPDVIRLKWGVRLDPHRREDMISKLAPVAFDADAEAPVFEAFIARVLPDPAIRGFVQRYLGYSLTALTREQVFVFFWGQGRNGKSTLVDLVGRIMGDYATTVPFETLAGDDRRRGSEATPDLARLPGARLVRAAEPEQKMKFRESMVKSLTSGEPIPVRRLHADFIDFYPTFKLLVSGNHKPSIEGTDDGIWRRVLLVPWEVQVPAEELDRDLPDKLWAERAGVLNWLIEGALDYLEHGLGPPDAVRGATEEYREESDPVGAFLRAACEITGNDADFESPGDLHAAYEAWCKQAGVNAWTPSTFSRRLPDKARSMGFRKAKSVGMTIYRGIRIRAEFRPDSRPSGTHGDAWN